MLGTDLHFSTDVTGPLGIRSRRAQKIEATVLREVERLEQCFSMFRDDSAFRAWQRGEIDLANEPDLAHVLRHAVTWVVRSHGTCNPIVGAASRRWAQASVDQCEPAPHELNELAAAANEWAQRAQDWNARTRTNKQNTNTQNTNKHHTNELHRNDHTALADLEHLFPIEIRSQVVLHAMAKGYIVDCAAAAGLAEAGAESITINIGGDLVRRGTSAINVSVQDPLRPFDNADPLTVVRVHNSAMASSGSSERGFRINGRHHSHVLDPRTAQPVDHVLSASVVADSALLADTIATAYSVMNAHEREGFHSTLAADDALASVGFCVVEAGGRTTTNAVWNALVTR